jgi:hypothetical protein
MNDGPIEQVRRDWQGRLSNLHAPGRRRFGNR